MKKKIAVMAMVLGVVVAKSAIPAAVGQLSLGTSSRPVGKDHSVSARKNLAGSQREEFLKWDVAVAANQDAILALLKKETR